MLLEKERMAGIQKQEFSCLVQQWLRSQDLNRMFCLRLDKIHLGKNMQISYKFLFNFFHLSSEVLENSFDFPLLFETERTYIVIQFESFRRLNKDSSPAG